MAPPGGRQRRGPTSLSRAELRQSLALWPEYFEGAGGEAEPPPSDLDPRLATICLFKNTIERAEAGARAAVAAEASDGGEGEDGQGEGAGWGGRARRKGPLHGCDLRTATSVVFAHDELCELVQEESGGSVSLKQALFDNPRVMLGCLDMALVLIRHATHPDLNLSHKLTARVVGSPPFGVSELKANLAGKYISLVGNVLRVSSISPMVLRADFRCSKCDSLMPRHFVDGKFNPPSSCSGEGCRARTFELLRDSAVTVDYQKVKLQEIENEASEAGRMPRSVEVELTEDLVETCIPGDVVTIGGIVKSINAEFARGRMNKKASASGLHLQFVCANSLVNSRRLKNKDQSKLDPAGDVEFSRQDLKAIREIASDESPFALLVASLCPGIFGHDLIKAGLVLALFGGSPRESEIPVRSDLHVLVVGDPGLGKSQMLRAVHQVAPRSVYVCGNTTSTTGLTVTLVKEGSEVGLEAGALVLSDQGVCCIDEFDKLACDPHAMLESMEQQQISVAKSGVVASLSARCSVMAAANPIGGHYNKDKSVAENLKMSSALLSRFDLVFILVDKADAEHDDKLSRHVMRLHALADGKERGGAHIPHTPGRAGGGDRDEEGAGGGFLSAFALQGRTHAHTHAHTEGPEGPIEGPTVLSQRLKASTARYSLDPLPPDLIRKYIAYAKRYVSPKLSLEAARVLQKLYLTMRKEASDGQSMPITTRQLESLVRLSQARARAELREEVTRQDAKDVVDMMQEALLEAYTGDNGVIDFGRSSSKGLGKGKQVKVFVSALNKEAAREGSAMFSKQSMLTLANRIGLNIPDFDGFVELLRAENFLLLKGPRIYELQTSAFSSGSSQRSGHGWG